MEPWKTLSSRYLMQDKWLTVRVEKCLTPRNIIIDPYYIIEYSDWVQVAAINKENQILIVKQFRQAAQKFCYELPGGVIENDEPPLIAAKRELLEETGCSSDKFISLGSFYANPAVQTNKVYSYLATDTAYVKQPEPDEGEDITYSFESIDKVFDLIKSGEFSQGLHIASIMLAFKQLNLIKNIK